VALGVLLALVALVSTPWAVRQRRRRHRLHQARHGDPDALWAELSDTAVDLGFVWSPARTPRQVARWLAAPSGPAAGSLQTLADAVERSRYAPPDATETGDGRRLLGEFTAVRTGLNANRSPRERLRAQLWPASLGWSGVSGLSRRLRWRRRH
jgi:hypothetical protein